MAKEQDRTQVDLETEMNAEKEADIGENKKAKTKKIDKPGWVKMKQEKF